MDLYSQSFFIFPNTLLIAYIWWVIVDDGTYFSALWYRLSAQALYVFIKTTKLAPSSFSTQAVYNLFCFLHLDLCLLFLCLKHIAGFCVDIIPGK